MFDLAKLVKTEKDNWEELQDGAKVKEFMKRLA